METTKLFLITYFAALAGVIPPGLINMSVVKTCLERGKKRGILLALGASTIVLFQALIAILLAKYIFNNPFVRNMLLRTGAVIFLLMSIYFFIKAKRKNTDIKIRKNDGVRSFFKGMMISLLNVLPIPYFCALGAALNISGTVDYDLLSITFFILAAAAGTFTSLYIYALSFMQIKNKTEIITKYSNYFMAALMLLLVGATVIRIFNPWE